MIFFPVGASAQVTAPPPAPDPMTTTSACSVMATPGQVIASGVTQAPVAPRSLAWLTTRQNSRSPAAAASASRRFSSTTTPCRTLSVWGTTNGSGRASAGVRAVAPGVAAGERAPVVGQPLGQLDPRARLTGGVPLPVGVPPP